MPSFKRHFRRTILSRFIAGDSASTSIVVALSFIPMLSLLGAAVDLGRAQSRAAQIQRAADLAVLNAARNGADDAQRLDIATRMADASLSHLDDMTYAPPEVVANGNAVTVTIAASLPAMFTQVIGYRSITITRSATAAYDTQTAPATYDRACILAASDTGAGLYMDAATLSARCGVYVNSSGLSALDVDGASSLAASFTCVSGNTAKDSSATISPPPSSGCSPLADPFAALAAPASAGDSCQFTQKLAADGESLSPGVYCEGLEVESNAAVTFEPGVYVIRGGQFKIGAQAAITGSDVLFYLSGANARLHFDSAASVRLKGLASGELKGLLIWNTSSNSTPSQFGFAPASFLEGAIYAPQTAIEISGSGQANSGADWTLLVAKSLSMGPNSNLQLQTRFSSGATPMPLAIEAGGLRYQGYSAEVTATAFRLMR